MMNLLIAVDGSPHAHRAIETAGRLAQEMPGLQAVLIHVRETTAYASEVSPFNAETLEAMLRQRQDMLLQASVAQARLAGLDRVRAASLSRTEYRDGSSAGPASGSTGRCAAGA